MIKMEKFVPITIKTPERLVEMIDLLAKKHFETRSAYLRDIIVENVVREYETVELRERIIDEWLKGNLRYPEIESLIGKNEAEKIKVFRNTLEKSISRAKKLAE